MFDSYAGTVGLLIIGLAEIILVIYVYGMKRWASRLLLCKFLLLCLFLHCSGLRCLVQKMTCRKVTSEDAGILLQDPRRLKTQGTKFSNRCCLSTMYQMFLIQMSF